MTDKIEPALSQNFWRRLPNGVRGLIVDDGRIYAKGDRDSGVRGIPAISVVPDDEPSAAIALLNSFLPDSDPRKITREKIALLHTGADAMLRGGEWSGDHRQVEQLREFADALESYLPPSAPVPSAAMENTDTSDNPAGVNVRGTSRNRTT